jgi:PTS hybrid protein
VIVDAPFVEGAVAAVVTAASGADLETVVKAAEEARNVPKL